MIKVVGDPGSCHMGEMDLAKELVRVGSEAGLSAVKFQIFKDAKNGNIKLPEGAFKKLVRFGEELGIEVFASYFDTYSLENEIKDYCKSIKVAHSMRSSVDVDELLKRFETVYVSHSYLDVFGAHPKITRLLCIPEYPVFYWPRFDEYTFQRFQGFSDHTLGIESGVAAMRSGAMVIEKHFRLDDDRCDGCPDGKFAIRPFGLENLVRMANKLHEGVTA